MSTWHDYVQENGALPEWLDEKDFGHERSKGRVLRP